ncbi:hypothetical protein WK13_34830 [Burkholderia ubonensis]|uniref:XkdF-like putative serine protease domain-containing protein n=1 Tax=Burkholderia ubonensis TaxID=101571 RepID=UPI000758DC3E|nr:XkdF-like putative serine protease domain-containing protein [Burkholderia ubonensis]KVR21716.1 hypothetical protein WK13_34830 [Burkholderia ubonensis]
MQPDTTEIHAVTGFVIKSEADTPEKQIIFSTVYAPNRPDSDGEFMVAEEIEAMAHRFAKKGEMQCIDVFHDNKVTECAVVESFIARKGDPDFIEGAWVVGIHIPDADLWDMVKKGDINGISMEALVTRHEREVTLNIPPVVTGMTTKSETCEDDHEHKFYVAYDDEGKFLGGRTDVVNGHLHAIVAGTITEESGTDKHRHRFSAVDSIEIVPE